MKDRTGIAVGLGVFLIVASYPVWNGLAAAGGPGRPELEPARDTSGCVEDTAYMAAHHQALLNEWRTRVVRGGERYYTSSSGRRWEMSLTGTCLECHGGKAGFCDRCHEYAEVRPTCWNCHLSPGGG